MYLTAGKQSCFFCLLVWAEGTYAPPVCFLMPGEITLGYCAFGQRLSAILNSALFFQIGFFYPFLLSRAVAWSYGWACPCHGEQAWEALCGQL